jgi:hypothetical protein
MEYNVKIAVTKDIKESLTACLTVDAGNEEQAKVKVKKMLETFESVETNSSQTQANLIGRLVELCKNDLIERLREFCEGDIKDFRLDTDVSGYVDTDTDILDVSPSVPA